MRVYSVRDGLSNQEFPGKPVTTRDRDRILVGSPDGLVMFTAADVHPELQSPRLLVQGIACALIMGLIGGLFPAIRAARLPVATALREL